MSYNSGVLKIKIYNVEYRQHVHAFCAVKLDSVMPQYRTGSLHGHTLAFDETADMFVKDLSVSNVTIELKPFSIGKNDTVLDTWTGSVVDIVRLIQRHQRAQRAKGDTTEEDKKEDPSEIVFLRGRTGTIRLGFGYTPLTDYPFSPDESPNSKSRKYKILRFALILLCLDQGLLTVQLLKATNLKAVDRSGMNDDKRKPCLIQRRI